jgi:hypothetical protein
VRVRVRVCVCVQARIKKIMQKDEDVGKVAQATPVLVCESLAEGLLSGFGRVFLFR